MCTDLVRNFEKLYPLSDKIQHNSWRKLENGRECFVIRYRKVSDN